MNKPATGRRAIRASNSPFTGLIRSKYSPEARVLRPHEKGVEALHHYTQLKTVILKVSQ